MVVELAALLIGDPPAAWSALGFTVDDGAAYVSCVGHVLDAAAPRGISGWSLRGVDASITDVDGLALGLPVGDPPPAPAPASTPDHPNGVVALDHVVLVTPDLGRTIEAIEAAGAELRRVRDAGRGRQQAFFKLGDVVLEVVGPATASAATAVEAPRFFGLAWTVRDLDATAAFLGDRLHPAKDAVQRGRRIATLDREKGGSSVSMAFMSASPE